MKQEDLVKAVAAEAGVSQTEANAVLKALGAVVQTAVKSGDEVTVPGICKIIVTTRSARTGRNPRTGEALQIAAKKMPSLSALKALKDAAAE